MPLCAVRSATSGPRSMVPEANALVRSAKSCAARLGRAWAAPSESGYARRCRRAAASTSPPVSTSSTLLELIDEAQPKRAPRSAARRHDSA